MFSKSRLTFAVNKLGKNSGVCGVTPLVAHMDIVYTLNAEPPHACVPEQL